jgi:hypothetical protein
MLKNINYISKYRPGSSKTNSEINEQRVFMPVNEGSTKPTKQNQKKPHHMRQSYTLERSGKL